MKFIKQFLFFIVMALFAASLGACEIKDRNEHEPSSASGVAKADAKVKTGSDGLTAEQRNVKRRLEEDNTPGAIKHLYILSAYSGQCILYSTVDMKVSSSGKRLSPSSVTPYNDGTNYYPPFTVGVGGYERKTTEVLGDDGTYGPSVEYIYWWDVRGVYHQHYVSGGQIVEISSKPLAVKNIIINIEEQAAEKSP